MLTLVKGAFFIYIYFIFIYYYFREWTPHADGCLSTPNGMDTTITPTLSPPYRKAIVQAQYYTATAAVKFLQSFSKFTLIATR